MEYGESSFDIVYLVFAITFGIMILVKRKDKVSLLFGIMTLLLCIGDAFHLIPRVLSYFLNDNLVFWKGLGKLITSVTMTIFYVLLELARKQIKNDERYWPLWTMMGLSAIRIILCAFPQNEWFVSPSSYLWGILRNIPFVFMGGLTVYLWFIDFHKERQFKFMWLLVALSFAFYLVTVLGASSISILGMMMLPKTICYILMIIYFFLYTIKKDEKTTVD
ncbi:MAG: hypothetical protein K6F07_03395 [Bacilli bacterium]|nr:hypothetical protein [Bacilli bacterium]